MPINIIRRRLEYVNDALKGKRIGICPADYGRFSSNLARLFAPLRPTSIFLDHKSHNNQGLIIFTDPSAFLDQIDACICFGKDTSTARLLFAASESDREVEFYDLLDKAGEFYLLNDNTSERYYFIDKIERHRSLAPDDAIVPAYVKRNFTSTAPANSRLTLRNHKVSLRKHHPFYQWAIGIGEVPGVCPICGEEVFSNSCFPITNTPFGAILFFHFSCHTNFYLMTGTYIPIVYGLYIPRLELTIINPITGDSSITIKMYAEKYSKTILSFKQHTLYFLEEAEAYLHGHEPRKLQALTGTIRQYGDHIRWEILGIESLVKDHFIPSRITRVANAGNDPFNIAKLIPDAPVAEAQGPTPERASWRVYRDAITGGYLTLLPSVPTFLSNSMARRIIGVCTEKTPIGTARSLRGFRARRSPVLWVSLRSKRRVWREQIQGVASILNALYESHPKLGVYFDGLASWEEDTIADITALLNPGIEVYNGLVNSLHETIFAAKFADVFFCPLGAGCIFSILTNTKTIIHGPRQFVQFNDDKNDSVIYYFRWRNKNEKCGYYLPSTWEYGCNNYLHEGEYSFDINNAIKLLLSSLSDDC